MSLNAWSILLIVFAAQCLFLLMLFTLRPSKNKKANLLLILLLFIILLIHVSTFFSASYLYRVFPAVAGFARGMVLLLGPVIYLYTLAILRPDFKFKPIQLLHLLPFAAALIIIKIQLINVSYQTVISSIDSLMSGTVQMSLESTLWFVAYFAHLLIYLFIAQKSMRRSVHDTSEKYLIRVEDRLRWLQQLTLFLAIIALVFAGIVTYIACTGLYSITGNYIYISALAVIVYLIAFQSSINGHVIVAGFEKKYTTGNLSSQLAQHILSKLLHLFETEKVFTDPELKIDNLARRVETTSHVLSQVINDKLNKSFYELLNYYRIEEIKVRLKNPVYANYSIMGIAYEVGYNSKSAFNTAFKKQTGLTPSAYLKSIK